MKLRRVSVMAILIAVMISFTAVSTPADDGNKQSVTVSFGAGLNTAQPGNSANHHVIPTRIKVKTGGVVNFVVAGFHWIFVYNPGKRAEDVVVPASGTFINDMNGLYFGGINPTTPTPPAGSVIQPSAAVNRVESVSFSQPGTYLVICNVRGHFLDGMFAYIEVSDGDDD